MDFLEKDLEDIIFNNTSHTLQGKGLTVYGTRKRQLRIGSYGVADLVTFKRVGQQLLITVYELKKKDLDCNSLMQAFRYCLGIEKYIQEYRGKDIELIFDVILVGKSICSGDFCYSIKFLTGVYIYLYSYDIDGIEFKKYYGCYKKDSEFNGND
jgi:hypothetical protein